MTGKVYRSVFHTVRGRLRLWTAALRALVMAMLSAARHPLKRVPRGNRDAASGIAGDHETAPVAVELDTGLDSLTERSTGSSAGAGNFAELFKKAPVPLCFAGKAAGMIHFNARFADLFGCTSEEVRTLNEWWNLTRPEPLKENASPAAGAAAIQAAVEAIIETEPSEYGVTCKNGERRIVVISGSSIGEGVLLTFHDVTERKRMEEALREGEERYRTLFDNSPAPVWELDLSEVKGLLEGLRTAGGAEFGYDLAQYPEKARECASLAKVIAVNRAALKLHGAADKAQLQAGLFDTLTPESLDTLKNELTCLWNGQGAVASDTVVRTLSGELRDITVSFSVCPGYESTWSRVLVSLVDITTRKKLEDTLRFVAQLGWADKSDSFLASLAQYLGEVLGVDYVVIDRLGESPGTAETVALYAKGNIVPNMQYCLKGTPCENVMGKRLCYYPQGVRERFPEDALLVEMGVDSYAGVPLWDQSGKGIGLIAVMDGKPFRDDETVTQTLQVVAVSAAAYLEREKSDLLIRQREQEFRTLADNIPDLIVRYDSGMRRTFVNHAWEEASGLTAAEVVNLPPESVPRVPSPIVSDYLEKIRRVLATGCSEKVEFNWENAQGRLLFLEYLIVPEHDQEGRIVGALSVGRDITKRKLDEQERQAHLKYFESMDRINRSLQGAREAKGMMGHLLEEVLAIFECDRAWLSYPCDREAANWRVPAERTRPEYAGASDEDAAYPVDQEVALMYGALLASDEPLAFGSGNERPLPGTVAETFEEQSRLALAIHPRIDQPYLFGIAQCRSPRVWTREERRLFKEIGRRLTDSITSLRMYSDLQESERRYRLVFEYSPVSIWEEDFSGVGAYLRSLRQDGVTDLEEYFDRHNQALWECAERVKVVNVNRAALALHGATRKEELYAGLVYTFTPESFDTFRQELVGLWNGGKEMTRDSVVKTLAGDPRQVTVYFSVCPGYEETLGKVLVSLADITARKEAEESLRELNAELELRVKKRTAELEDKNAELARLNKIFIGRELRMMELKEQIRELTETRK